MVELEYRQEVIVPDPAGGAPVMAMPWDDVVLVVASRRVASRGWCCLASRGVARWRGVASRGAA